MGIKIGGDGIPSPPQFPHQESVILFLAGVAMIALTVFLFS
jgi:hypothetical protein